MRFSRKDISCFCPSEVPVLELREDYVVKGKG
jgi:hypothetical protein